MLPLAADCHLPPIKQCDASKGSSVFAFNGLLSPVTRSDYKLFPMSRQSVLSSVASRAVSRAVTSLLLPGLFVFLWSTGFIGSKVVMQYAPPLTFLALRFALAAIVLAPFLFILKTQWPTRFLDYVHSAIVGALVHAIYLGGVFWAISLGTGAGLSSLIVGLQPLLTLCLSVALLGERAGKLKIAGVLTGLVGFAVVIAGRTTINELSLDGLMLCGAALIAISAGTVYQKRITTGIQLLPGVFVQYIGAFIVTLPAALLLEPIKIEWNTEFVFATAWLVLVLSVGAVFLLMRLIRSSEAGNVASLFYLVPPLTAIEAWLLFSESLTMIAIGGMLLCVAGVAMVLHTADSP